MKKLFSLFAAVLFAGSMMATDYEKVTTAPTDWSGEYVIAATLGGKALVWTGVDAGQCHTDVTITDGVISGDFITVIVEAMTEGAGYSIKVNGGTNDGKYISSGTSAPTYSNGLKFIDKATRVDFAFNTDGTVAMSQTIGTSGTMYFIYNKNSGVSNERYRFYKDSNYGSANYLTPYLYKKKEVTPSSVANPVFSVAAGSYYDAQTITLTCATEESAIFYTVDGTEPTTSSTPYLHPIYLPVSATIKAIAVKGEEKSEVVTKEYVIAEHYTSLSELVEKAGAPAGQKVVVDLNKEKIVEIFVTSQDKRNGVYVMAGDRKLEIYCYDVPAEWEVGGTLSGTLKGEWKNYNGQWEVCPANWEGLTYVEPLSEGPAITVDVTAKTFSIVPANEGDIFMFMLLTSNMEYPLSKETAIALAEENVSWIDADFTLEEYVEEGYAYQEALENIPFAMIAEGGLTNGKYALAAFTLEEEDATLHTAKMTSEVSYVEFTISDTPTAVENIEAVKATKVVKDGQVMIIRDGKTYNVMGIQL